MSYGLQHIVHMRSKDRDENSYPDPSGYRTVLSHPIAIPPGHCVVASLQSAQIPFSFYPVNSKNNTLITQVTTDAGTTDNTDTVTLTSGNYTATELRDEIQSKLRETGNFSDTAESGVPKLEVTYDSKTNKYTITATALAGAAAEDCNVTIKANTTCGKLLGLKESILTSDVPFADAEAASVSLISPYAINVAGDDTIYLRTNLGTGRSMSYETRTQNSGDLLAKIPIRVSPFSIIHYDADESTFKAQIKDSGQIDEVQVRLTDSENRPINFNGIDNEISIKFEVVRKPDFENYELMKRDPYKQDRTLYRPKQQKEK